MIFTNEIKKKLDRLLDKTISAKVPGLAIKVEHTTGEAFEGYRGNISEETQYFIASTTKLYVTAILFKMIQNGKLSLEDPISKLLPESLFTGLHIYRTVDYSKEIRIQDLMAHTSGLPDYFQAKRGDGKSLLKRITGGEDQSWDLDQVLGVSRQLGGQFVPGSGKALYSDTNYQLLGKIIEESFEKKISEVLKQEVFEPLNLSKTYLYLDTGDQRPIDLNYKNSVLKIPRAMASFGPDGGIVSTASDSMVFLRAFFEGRIFEPAYLQLMTKNWNRIFFPLQYGIGVSLFRLPWFFSPFKRMPDLIGHSGLSGAFEFYCPDRNVFLAGTVNQIANPQISFQLMIRALIALES